MCLRRTVPVVLLSFMRDCRPKLKHVVPIYNEIYHNSAPSNDITMVGPLDFDTRFRVAYYLVHYQLILQ